MNNRTIAIALRVLLVAALVMPVAQSTFLAASEPPAPAAIAAGAPLPPPAAPATPSLDASALHPGARLECRYGSQWRRVTVLHVHAGRSYVHFDGCADTWNRWALAAELRPRATALPTVKPLEPPGRGDLEGVHLESVLWPQISPGSVIPYVFRRDGTVVRGRLAAASVATHFGAVQREDPACAGIYRVDGPRLEIAWAGGGARTVALRRTAGRVELAGFVHTGAWPEGNLLDGRYRPLESAALDRVFHTDGTVTRERAPVHDAAPDRGRTARYEIDGNVLTIRTARGTQRELAYPLGARLLSMGGQAYRLVDEGSAD